MFECYIRPDGAEMVTVAPHCAVARLPAERLGLIPRQINVAPPVATAVADVVAAVVAQPLERPFEPTERQKATIRLLARLGNSSAAIADTVGVPLSAVKRFRK